MSFSFAYSIARALANRAGATRWLVKNADGTWSPSVSRPRRAHFIIAVEARQA